MLFAWRFSRTFASRFNFANVVFFLPAKVDLQVAQANRGLGRHDGDALSTVLRPADARPRPERLATSTANAPSAQRAEASFRRRGQLESSPFSCSNGRPLIARTSLSPPAAREP